MDKSISIDLKSDGTEHKLMIVEEWKQNSAAADMWRSNETNEEAGGLEVMRWNICFF